MNTIHYDWKRFWLPRGDNPATESSDFFPDPDDEFGHFRVPNARANISLLDIPCLILLGEAGIGKSTELNNLYLDHEQRAHNLDEAVIFKNLRQYGSEDRLIREIFESNEFVEWKDGQTKLCLILDSLDEALIRIDTIASVLVESLKKCPIERLSLRIGCRSGAWPRFLEDSLKDLWCVPTDEDADALCVYTMAPLRKQDVIIAAEARNLDSEAFTDALIKKDVVALASRPITLEMLMRLYAKSSEFPRRKSSLYGKGCRELCTEQSLERDTPELRGALNPEQRLILAGRVAALSVLCGRPSIHMDPSGAGLESMDLSINEVLGGTEEAHGNSFDVTLTAVREVMTSTAMFTQADANHIGWAHRSYAEYLAAWYLYKHDLEIEKIEPLFVQHLDSQHRVVPQLAETYAWLASLREDVFVRTIKIDPIILLTSDNPPSNQDERFNLVKALLILVEEERLFGLDLRYYQDYPALDHDELESQLRDVLRDSSLSNRTREAAIDIARVGGIESLQEDLVAIICEPASGIRLRSHAAFALEGKCSVETAKKTEHLVLSDDLADEHDQLKGSLLKLHWPTHLDTATMFKLLHLPRRDSFYGFYENFIRSIPDGLDAQDLGIALDWIATSSALFKREFHFEHLIATIMRKAWAAICKGAIIDQYYKAAIVLLNANFSLFGDERENDIRSTIGNDENGRRKLLCGLVEACSQLEEFTYFDILHEPALVVADDQSWYLDQIEECNDAQRRIWSELLRWIYVPESSSDVDRLLDLSARHREVADEFSAFLEPMVLQSQRAQDIKKRYEENKKFQGQKSAGPSIEKRVRFLLDRFEDGETGHWSNICGMLGKENGSSQLFNPLVEEYPAWAKLSEADANRVVMAARTYLEAHTPQPKTWMGTNLYVYADHTGLHAFLLLLRRDREYLLSLSAERWKSWAEVIVLCPVQTSDTFVSDYAVLVDMATRHASDRISSALEVLIRKGDRENSMPHHLRSFTECKEKILSSTVYEIAKDESLRSETRGYLLDWLLKRKHAPAESYAREIFEDRVNEVKVDSLRVEAAVNLMIHADDSGWNLIWPYFRMDFPLGRKIVEAYADKRLDSRQGNLASKLGESQLADLYIWMSLAFPHALDPDHDGVHHMGSLDLAIEWRNSLLAELKKRGTKSACEGIRVIFTTLPHLDWLRWVLNDAEDLARQQSWEPVEPLSLLELIRVTDARVVLDDDHLLELVVQSLRRYEKELRTETPAVEDLWFPSNDSWKPRNEEAFSNHVKRYLANELGGHKIVVNREVNVRKGQYTDIHIDAIKTEGAQPAGLLKVIVESKGCWNRQLNSKMRTQLRGRYLSGSDCRRGIYLVAWFLCDEWDHTDYRKDDTPQTTLDDLQAQLDNQADTLSGDTTRIAAVVVDCRYGVQPADKT